MATRLTMATGVEVTVPDEAVEHYLQAGFLLDAGEADDEALEGEAEADEDSPIKTTRKRK